MEDNKKLYRYTFYLTGRDDVLVVDADDMSTSSDGETWELEINNENVAEVVIQNVAAWTLKEVGDKDDRPRN